MRAKNSLCITANGTFQISFLHTPKPLLTSLQKSPKYGAKMSLLSTNIPRRFEVRKWTKLHPFAARDNKWALEEQEKNCEKYFRHIRG